ncbi:MAG: hypothetical protein ACHREM_15765 [Polyangiales bacterium]
MTITAAHGPDGRPFRYRYEVHVDPSDPLLSRDAAADRLAAQFAAAFSTAPSAEYHYFGPLVPVAVRAWIDTSYQPDRIADGWRRGAARLASALIRGLERSGTTALPRDTSSDLRWFTEAERRANEAYYAVESVRLEVRGDAQVHTGPGGVTLTGDGDVIAIVELPALPHLARLENMPANVAVTGAERGGAALAASGAPSGIETQYGVGTSATSRLRITLATAELTSAPAPLPAHNRLVLVFSNCAILGRHEFNTPTFRATLSSAAVGRPTRSPGQPSLRMDLDFVTPQQDSSEIVSALTDLLSVASRARVSCLHREEWVGNTLLRAQLVPGASRTNSIHSLLENRSAATVGEFLEKTLPGYFTNRDDYNLRHMIEWYVRSHEDSVVEARLVFASVFMEAFKFAWANTKSKHAAVKGINGLVREFQKPNPTKPGKMITLGFRELLVEAATDIGVAAPTYTFFDNRNSLFHSGMSALFQLTGGGSVRGVLMNEFSVMAIQMDDILLRLLGYSGNLRRFGAAGSSVFP